MDTYRWVLQVVLRPQETQGFKVVKQRWKVENIQLQCRHNLQAEFYPYCGIEELLQLTTLVSQYLTAPPSTHEANELC
jgi:hypothetical protein